MSGSAKRGAERSGQETQARLPEPRRRAGQTLRAGWRRGQGPRPHGRAGGVGSGGARTALRPRLRAARLPAPLWLLGTNSGQSHDAGAARSASLPGAGGVSRGWEPGWEGQGGAAGAATAARAGRGPHPLGWRQPPEGSASHWQTRTPPCPSPPPPPAPPPPAPRPVTRGQPDRHSLFPGAGAPPRRLDLSREARRGLGAGREQPPPGSPPWASTRPSAPPRALRPEPRARGPALAVPASLLRPEPRGEGRAALSAPGVTRSRPAALLPKHTARVRRRTGVGEAGGGAGPSITHSRGKGCPSRAEGDGAGVVAQDARPGARERGASGEIAARCTGSRCSLRAGAPGSETLGRPYSFRLPCRGGAQAPPA